MLFFQNFPVIEYALTETSGNSTAKVKRTIPNMTIKLVMDIFSSPSLTYNEYRIRDEERPDTIAAKIYGASRYAWIIMLANNMRDWYDWPLTDSEFYSYIERKYGSISTAKSEVHQLIWIMSDGQQLVVDDVFYATLSPTQRKTISVYDYEYQQNDNKRIIRLPAFENLNYIVSQTSALLNIP